MIVYAVPNKFGVYEPTETVEKQGTGWYINIFLALTRNGWKSAFDFSFKNPIYGSSSWPCQDSPIFKSKEEAIFEQIKILNHEIGQAAAHDLIDIRKAHEARKYLKNFVEQPKLF